MPGILQGRPGEVQGGGRISSATRRDSHGFPAIPGSASDVLSATRLPGGFVMALLFVLGLALIALMAAFAWFCDRV